MERSSLSHQKRWHKSWIQFINGCGCTNHNEDEDVYEMVEDEKVEDDANDVLQISIFML